MRRTNDSGKTSCARKARRKKASKTFGYSICGPNCKNDGNLIVSICIQTVENKETRRQ